MVTQKNPQSAFEQAIADKRLSDHATAWNYAGHFMYMGTLSSGEDMFKHTATRRYLGSGNREIQAFATSERIAS